MPTEWHDLTLEIFELRAHASLTVTDWLAVDALWAVRTVAVQYVLRDGQTMQPIAPPYGVDLHHRTETIVGPTDPWLGLRVGRTLEDWTVLVRGGVTLPVGATVPNPFALGRAGIVHEHIQLGTGTVDPFLEVELRRRLGEHLTLAASLLGKAPLYANPHGFQAGAQLLGTLRATSDLFTRRLHFNLGVTVYDEQPERWDGVEESEGNLGRVDLLVGSGVSCSVGAGLIVTLAARLPVFTVAKGEQLSTPALIELAVSREFALW